MKTCFIKTCFVKIWFVKIWFAKTWFATIGPEGLTRPLRSAPIALRHGSALQPAEAQHSFL